MVTTPAIARLASRLEAVAADRRGSRLLLVLLGALLFLPGLGRHDLWNPDEPRYAEVTREMLLDGDLLVPHLNGEVYRQKPPLEFWAMAAGGKLLGRLDENAARLPSALSAIATLLLVFSLGERFFDRRTAWSAAVVFATTSKILWQGHTGQIDMLLTFLVTLAMFLWARGHLERRPGFYWLFFLVAGLATLAKGPVGLLPPLLAIVAYLLAAGEPREIARLRPVRGLLLWAVVVLAWLLPAALVAGPAYLRELAFHQTVTRYADPWHHFRSWHYYFGVVAVDFLPWSFLLPVAAAACWRERFGPLRRGVLFTTAWALVTFVFFSLSPAKRTVYLLPLYPALALLVGCGLTRIRASWPRDRRRLELSAGFLAAVFVIVAICGILVLASTHLAPLSGAIDALGPHADWRAATAPLGHGFLAELLLLLTILALGALAAWLACRRGRIGPAIGALAGAMTVTSLLAFLHFLPRFDAVKSARPLARTLVTRLRPGEEWGIYPALDAGYLFYSRRFAVVLESPEALREFSTRREPSWVIAKRSSLAEVSPRPPLVEVARDQDVEQGYALLVSRPAGGSEGR